MTQDTQKANMTMKERREHMEREVAARREIMQHEEAMRQEAAREDYAAECRHVAARIITKLTALGAMEVKALYAHASSWDVELPTPACNTAPTRQFKTITARTGLVNTVMELLLSSGRILQKRSKFQTTDFGSLTHVVTGARSHTYRKHLRNWRIVRLDIERTRDLAYAEDRKRAHAQVTIISHPEATPQQIVQAARVAKAARNGNLTYTPDRHSGKRWTRQVEDTYYYANRVDHSADLQDPAEIPLALNVKDDGTPGTSGDKPAAAPLAWERTPWINNVDYDLYTPTGYTPEVKATIRYQDKIGQGRRNAARVAHSNKQRWLESEDGLAWLDAKAMEIGKNDYTEVNVASYSARDDNPLPEMDDDAFSVAFD